MRKTILSLFLGLIVCNAWCGDSRKPTPSEVSQQFVGTYAELDDPKYPQFTVVVVKGVLSVVDRTGKKKRIGQVTLTDDGLVFVEADRDRNTFRLSYEPKENKYYLEYLGEAKKNRPLPSKATFKKEYIKIAPSSTDQKGEGKKK